MESNVFDVGAIPFGIIVFSNQISFCVGGSHFLNTRVCLLPVFLCQVLQGLCPVPLHDRLLFILLLLRNSKLKSTFSIILSVVFQKVACKSIRLKKSIYEPLRSRRSDFYMLYLQCFSNILVQRDLATSTF